MPFELLSNLRPQLRHWHIQGVHLLDFRRLERYPISLLTSFSTEDMPADRSQPLPVGMDNPPLRVLPAHRYASSGIFIKLCSKIITYRTVSAVRGMWD